MWVRYKNIKGVKKSTLSLTSAWFETPVILVESHSLKILYRKTKIQNISIKFH